ncbi:GIY-YIG nuclease family protein [Halapricum hydrolyticum]|uniref:GIY-YIG nuclease family protein n=1 Tax=Halapricum hydrolyticum TaxID=2979991 RepID=A0AAE3ICY8_9EURY|nr:GIY-YIG nuclease family protein [Halapricum hydrolyticum]MCU4718811.1 GIY-YIG nuclease family protein [Halapricum hydrolyticum]MCU4727781.1 GIY-YIG nuclease family protein [Halapricum hydrolyticum]
MTSGTYTLLIELPEATTITFGAAGDRELAAGVYAYTGSAFGPGGFSRIDRHRRVASGEHDARHWHVDYLLGHPGTRIVEVVRSADADIECAVSQRLAGEPVEGIGASDCDCDTHLVYGGRSEAFLDEVRRAHASARND